MPNATWKRYVKYLYFDGNLPRALDRKVLVEAAYAIAKPANSRVRRIGEEATEGRSFSTIEFLVPTYNQVNLLYDGTIAAYSWATDDGRPQFIDCPPLTEVLAKKYSQFFVAPRAELMAPLTDDLIAELLPSDRKLLVSSQITTVGEAIFHVMPTD